MEEDRRKREREAFLRKLALGQARMKSDNAHTQDRAPDTTYIPFYGYYRYPPYASRYRYPHGKYPRRPGHGYRPHPKPLPSARPCIRPGYGNRTSSRPWPS